MLLYINSTPGALAGDQQGEERREMCSPRAAPAMDQLGRSCPQPGKVPSQLLAVSEVAQCGRQLLALSSLLMGPGERGMSGRGAGSAWAGAEQ